MWSFVTTDTVHVQRSYVTVDYKKLLFISIEHHANISTKEQYFSYYWNYMGAKYLKHFHLIEINKWRQYKTFAKLFGSKQQIRVKTSHIFQFIQDTIKVKLK